MIYRNRWLAPAVVNCSGCCRAARMGAGQTNVEEVVAQATRSGRSTENDPIRVEVLEREEIEEKIMMVPGNIAMLVSETPGVRTQITSPSLGAANIRMQGMKGRYTQLLADGLPIYGGQAPAIGLLQIPPTDLGQVEIIKGAASALYGPSALGGVINLVSRRPGATPQTEFLLNTTSRNGQDVTAYTAAFLSDAWGYSFTGGFRPANPPGFEQRWLGGHARLHALERAAAPVLGTGGRRQGVSHRRRDDRAAPRRHLAGAHRAGRIVVPAKTGQHTL